MGKNPLSQRVTKYMEKELGSRAKDKRLIYLLAESLMDMCSQHCQMADNPSEWDNLCMAAGEQAFALLESLGLVTNYNGRSCIPNREALERLKRG